jgi:hypothetical protein
MRMRKIGGYETMGTGDQAAERNEITALAMAGDQPGETMP